MNDQNRYEEVPQKENKFVKGLKTFGSYLKFVFVDFFNSFKYNNMKLAAILFAMPGILLGFFMFAHVPTIRKVTVSYDQNVDEKTAIITPTLESGSNYSLTIKSYNDYNNIVMNVRTYDDMKDDKDFNQDIYPINGYSSTKTKQLSTPVVSGFEDKSAGSDETSDSYSITVSGLDSELNEVASYALFVFQSVKIGETTDNTDPTNPVKVDVYGDYYISNIYRTFDTSNTALNNFSTLNKDNKYKVAIKALAKDSSEYYSSNLSELFDISEIVTKNGTEVSVKDYDDNDTRFIQYSGTYTVATVDGSTPDETMSKFELEVLPNGYVTFKFNDTESSAKLQLNGSTLQSVEVKKVHILPFDFSGLCIFFLTLLGFLNVFLSLELSKKKNFGTVMKCLATTLLILGIGALYIYCLVATNSHLGEGKLLLLDNKNQVIKTVFDSNAIISIVTVCASGLFSVAGLILAFINYDRTYEKVDR